MLKILPKFKFFFLAASLFSALLLCLVVFTPVKADDPTVTPTDGRKEDGNYIIDDNTPAVEIVFSGLSAGQKYTICFETDSDLCKSSPTPDVKKRENVEPVGGKIQLTVCGDEGDRVKEDCDQTDGDWFHAEKTYKVHLMDKDTKYVLDTASFYVGHWYPDLTFSPEKPTPNDPWNVTLTGHRYGDRGGEGCRFKYDLDLYINGNHSDDMDKNNIKPEQDISLKDTDSKTHNVNPQLEGSHMLDVTDDCKHFVLYRIRIEVKTGGGSHSIVKTTDTANVKDFVPKIQPDKPVPDQFMTPIGPVKTTPQGLAKFAVNVGVGIAGGIAFLLMVFGSYRLIFAGGDPEAVQQGRQIITAAIAGLIVIAFSVYILNLIGVAIFGLKIGT